MFCMSTLSPNFIPPKPKFCSDLSGSWWVCMYEYFCRYRNTVEYCLLYREFFLSLILEFSVTLWRHWVLDLKLPQHVYYTYLGFEVVAVVVVRSFIFWYITACSPLKVNWRFEGRCLVQAYSSTQKMEETGSSETLVDFQRTIRHYVPQYDILHVYHRFDIAH
jgi:hypothetical protein